MYNNDEILSLIMEEVNTISYREKKNVEKLLEDTDNKFKVSDALVNTLYKLSMEKYEDLDVSSIEKSKGDITKFEGYESMRKAIEYFDNDFSKSISSLKDSDLFLEQVKTAKETLHLLEAEKSSYQSAYANNVKLVQVSYCTSALSLLVLLNHMISESIHVITTCNNSVFTYPSGMRETKEFVVYENIKKYNESVKNGTIEKILKMSNSSIHESFAVGAVTVIGITVLIFLLIKSLRALINLIYNMRLSITDYLKTINEYLDANQYNINHNKELSTEQKKKVIAKQKNAIAKVNKLINFFELKFVRADKKTKNEINKKVQVQEIRDKLTNVSSNVNTFSLI